MFHLAIVFMPLLVIALIGTLVTGVGLLITALVGGASAALVVRDKRLRRLLLLGCGILALVGSTCFYLSIPCAAVGILLALLSRGRKEHMSNRAKTGLCISAAGLVLTVGLTSYTLYHYRDLFSSSEFQQRMKDYMDYYYSGSETEAEEDGESNILKDFFGDDKGNSSDGEQQTPETEIPYIDDTPYGSDPYSGSSPYGSYPYGSSPYGGQNSSTTPGPAV